MEHGFDDVFITPLKHGSFIDSDSSSQDDSQVPANTAQLSYKSPINMENRPPTERRPRSKATSNPRRIAQHAYMEGLVSSIPITEDPNLYMPWMGCGRSEEELSLSDSPESYSTAKGCVSQNKVINHIPDDIKPDANGRIGSVGGTEAIKQSDKQQITSHQIEHSHIDTRIGQFDDLDQIYTMPGLTGLRRDSDDASIEYPSTKRMFQPHRQEVNRGRSPKSATELTYTDTYTYDSATPPRSGRQEVYERYGIDAMFSHRGVQLSMDTSERGVRSSMRGQPAYNQTIYSDEALSAHTSKRTQSPSVRRNTKRNNENVVARPVAELPSMTVKSPIHKKQSVSDAQPKVQKNVSSISGAVEIASSKDGKAQNKAVRSSSVKEKPRIAELTQQRLGAISEMQPTQERPQTPPMNAGITQAYEDTSLCNSGMRAIKSIPSRPSECVGQVGTTVHPPSASHVSHTDTPRLNNKGDIGSQDWDSSTAGNTEDLLKAIQELRDGSVVELQGTGNNAVGMFTGDKEPLIKRMETIDDGDGERDVYNDEFIGESKLNEKFADIAVSKPKQSKASIDRRRSTTGTDGAKTKKNGAKRVLDVPDAEEEVGMDIDGRIETIDQSEAVEKADNLPNEFESIEGGDGDSNNWMAIEVEDEGADDAASGDDPGTAMSLNEEIEALVELDQELNQRSLPDRYAVGSDKPTASRLHDTSALDVVPIPMEQDTDNELALDLHPTSRSTGPVDNKLRRPRPSAKPKADINRKLIDKNMNHEDMELTDNEFAENVKAKLIPADRGQNVGERSLVPSDSNKSLQVQKNTLDPSKFRRNTIVKTVTKVGIEELAENVPTNKRYSQRTRIRTLKWWAGEKINYGRLGAESVDFVDISGGSWNWLRGLDPKTDLGAPIRSTKKTNPVALSDQKKLSITNNDIENEENPLAIESYNGAQEGTEKGRAQGNKKSGRTGGKTAKKATREGVEETAYITRVVDGMERRHKISFTKESLQFETHGDSEIAWGFMYNFPDGKGHIMMYIKIKPGSDYSDNTIKCIYNLYILEGSDIQVEVTAGKRSWNDQFKKGDRGFISGNSKFKLSNRGALDALLRISITGSIKG